MIFELHFLSDDIGRVVIDEPIGYNTLSFDFMQKEKGFGRDISFNGGELQLEFTHTRNHYLPEILYYFNYYGFESKIQLLIDNEIIGDLDFAKAESDGLEYFKCKVIQDSKLQTIKRRSKVKVDMFASKDLDGEVIDPLVPTNILVKAKADFQKGIWIQEDVFDIGLDSKSSYGKASDDANTAWYFANPCNNISDSGLDGMLTFFNRVQIDKKNEDYPTFCELEILKANQNLKKININIKDAVVKLSTVVGNGGNGYVDFNAYIKYGNDFNTAKTIKLPITASLSENKSFETTLNTNHTIESLSRGDSVWLFYEFKVRQSTTIAVLDAFFRCNTTISGMKTEITAESTGYSSITKAFRLVDVMRQTVKSYSGLQIASPKFDIGGEFYNNFLFDGKLLRSITDKPFEISLDDIENSITEMNADYEVNDRVFFGTYDEYYTNIECGFFDNTQFSGFSKKFNEKYSVNTINYKYKNYQALKENEQPNSSDTIHGETSMLFFNKMVENTKAITVDWIRDSFLIDEARKKSIEITTGTSYQNDTDIFAMDCLPNETDLTFTEVSELNHEWNGNNLILRSNETLNFNIIGLFENTPFEIKSPDKNAGFYTIFKVSNQELQLTWISGGVMTTNSDGVRFTQYTYTIPNEKIPYISRTNEDTVTDEIKSPETFANLLYSVKRNLVKYYGAYMATCNMFRKEKQVTNTTYYHNGKATISNAGLTTIESQSILPSEPILSPYMYENMVYSNVEFADFMNLQKDLRSKRGYVRSIDKNGNPIKVYPKKMTYKDLDKELTIIAEEKYEPIVMTIQTSNLFTTINGETKVSHLEWEIKDKQLSLFDRGRFRLYKPIFWYNVSINGSKFSSIKLLEDSLKLIK